MTNSLSFPTMFDIARNRVGVLENNASIVNRCRLLMLTEPTELYNNPLYGAGLKRHLWKYNNQNEQAIIQDRIKEQLRLHEPACDSDKTQFVFEETQNKNTLKMTVGIQTKFGDNVEVSVDGKSE